MWVVHHVMKFTVCLWAGRVTCLFGAWQADGGGKACEMSVVYHVMTFTACLCAGFLAQMVLGKSIEECVRCGTYIGNIIVQQPGFTLPGKSNFV